MSNTATPRPRLVIVFGHDTTISGDATEDVLRSALTGDGAIDLSKWTPVAVKMGGLAVGEEPTFTVTVEPKT